MVSAALLAALAIIPNPLEVRVYGENCIVPFTAAIVVEKKLDLPVEGYWLDIRPEGEIVIKCSDPAGEFYARQTLRQLKDDKRGYPCVFVKDKPVYRYRGMMIDDARHFFGKEIIKKELELMAQHKLNVFHWHLVDDQGWRIEIKRHPELVRFGSVRPNSVVFGGEPSFVEGDIESMSYELNTEKYGPFFYSQEDVREIIAYAAERHITVVPEIELPGHVRSLLAARPDLGCRGERLARVPRVLWSIEPDVLCAGNDDVLAYLDEVFNEICDLFPGPFIHIGGDECPKLRWKECPKCQARKVALGLSDERGLQSWMTGHFVRHLTAKGKRVIGWDEVLHGDVPKSVVGMSWRTSGKGGAGGDFVSASSALERGFEMIMAPQNLCYYSYRQGLAEDPYPYYASGGDLTLAQAYSFDPSAGIPDELKVRILGGQACAWSEMTFGVFDLEWKTWPRGCAMAEALWSSPKVRDYADFRARMTVHRRRLISDHVNCASFD